VSRSLIDVTCLEISSFVLILLPPRSGTGPDGG
jgi:hypothetical protein